MIDVDHHTGLVPLDDHSPSTYCHQIAVLMQCIPVSNNPWIDSKWEVLSVIPARMGVNNDVDKSAVEGVEHRIVRHDGLSLRLHPDESESYYHNLMVDDPRCFVVCRQDEDTDIPVPTLVTVSFDEANAYAEGDDRVESVSLPLSLHQAVESYVLTHFVPTKRTKRKRQNWKDKQ